MVAGSGVAAFVTCPAADRDSTGTLEDGVIPSLIGDIGDRRASGYFCDFWSTTAGGGDTGRPFSRSKKPGVSLLGHVGDISRISDGVWEEERLL